MGDLPASLLHAYVLAAERGQGRTLLLPTFSGPLVLGALCWLSVITVFTYLQRSYDIAAQTHARDFLGDGASISLQVFRAAFDCV